MGDFEDGGRVHEASIWVAPEAVKEKKLSYPPQPPKWTGPPPHSVITAH